MGGVLRHLFSCWKWDMHGALDRAEQNYPATQIPSRGVFDFCIIVAAHIWLVVVHRAGLFHRV